MTEKPLRVEAAMFRRPPSLDRMLPELRAIRRDMAGFARRRVVRQMLAACEKAADRVRQIPPLTHSLYAEYGRSGSRAAFDAAYHAKRQQMGIAALLALFGREREWIELLQDYVWSVCEETTWVPPEHASSAPIDLFAAETAFCLAEIASVFTETFDAEVTSRVREEVDRRVLTPYLDAGWSPWWQDGHNNWSGVCNGAVGAAFLYVERRPVRLARAVNKVLRLLERFLERAFAPDGGSSEGLLYWQYGLVNVVAFSELLRRRTGGRVDFLSRPKLRAVARYPLAVLVAPGRCYSCSDCSVEARVHPGMVSRLAERTGARALLSVLTPEGVAVGPGDFRWSLRNLLWWDGRTRAGLRLDDRVLPATAVARMVSPRQKVAVMAKAGHNGENHNHNDVGSFAVYVDGEPLICDPGVGLYDSAYFGPRRYENPMCSSYGHSVPRISGALQKAGREFRGRITRFDVDGRSKELRVELAGAYGLPALRKLDRTISVETRGPTAGRMTLSDSFAFVGKPLEVEEAFVTWGRARVGGSSARIRGAAGGLRLRIVEPAGARFRVEEVPVRTAHSTRPSTLRRVSATLPAGATGFRMEIKAEPG